MQCEIDSSLSSLRCVFVAFELFQPAPMQAVWPGVATRVADPGGIDPDPTF